MRFDDVAFVDVELAHIVHDESLQLHGGMPGIRDLGMIESAVNAPCQGYYFTLAEMAAVYVHGLACNHGYVDGNKRTAAGVLMAFLGANGFPVVLADEWASIIEKVADKSITRHQLTDHIVTRLMRGVDVRIET